MICIGVVGSKQLTGFRSRLDDTMNAKSVRVPQKRLLPMNEPRKWPNVRKVEEIHVIVVMFVTVIVHDH